MASNGYFLRSRDVAHILDLTPDQVSELAHKGDLKAMKQGRLWRFRFNEVMAFKRRKAEEEEMAPQFSPFSSRHLSSPNRHR